MTKQRPWKAPELRAPPRNAVQPVGRHREGSAETGSDHTDEAIAVDGAGGVHPAQHCSHAMAATATPWQRGSW